MADVVIKLTFDDQAALSRMASFDQTQAQVMQSAAKNARLMATTNLEAAKAEQLNAKAILESSRSAKILSAARLVQMRAEKDASAATQANTGVLQMNARTLLAGSKASLDAQRAILNEAKARKAASDAARIDAATTTTATNATNKQTKADNDAAEAATKKAKAEQDAANRIKVSGENRQQRDEGIYIRQQIAGLRELERQQETTLRSRRELMKGSFGSLPLVGGLSQFGGGGMLGAGGGIAMGLGAAAGEAIAFQKTLVEMRNNTVLTDDEFKQFTGDIQRLGIETGAPMDKIADGFRKVKDYGFSAAEAMKVVTIATKAAVATGNDADTTSALLAETMHIFKLGANDAGHAMNTLYEAALLGRSTLKDFVEQSGVAMAIGAGLGDSLQSVAAVMSALSRNGLDLADASTQYKDALVHIEGPTEAVKKRLHELQDQYNATHKDQLNLVNDFSRYGVETKNLTGIIQDLAKAYDGHTEKIKEVIPALRGFVGTAILAQNGLSDMEQAQKALDDTMAGRSTPLTDAYARAHETLENKIKRVENEFLVMAINIGDKLLPMLASAADDVEKLANAFNSLSPETQEALTKLALATSGILLLGGTVGNSLIGLKGLVDLLGKSKIGMAGLGTAAAGGEAAAGIAGVGAAAAATETAQASLVTRGVALFGEAGPYAAALAVAAAGVWTIYNNWKQAREEQERARNAGYINVLNSPQQKVEDHKEAAQKIEGQDLPTAQAQVTTTKATLASLLKGGWQGYKGLDSEPGLATPANKQAAYTNAVSDARQALADAIKAKDALSSQLSTLKGQPTDVTYKDVLAAAQKAGDPHPNVTAAQWQLESGGGKHVSGAYNYFGIKALDYEPGTEKPTTEYVGGKPVRTTARFRDYADFNDGIQGHVDFLKQPRYVKAGYQTARTDEEAARDLQKGGYATDPNYAASLIKIMNEHKQAKAGIPGDDADPEKAAKSAAAAMVARAGLGAEQAKAAYDTAKAAFDDSQTVFHAVAAESLRRAQLNADIGEAKKKRAKQDLDSPDDKASNGYDYDRDVLKLREEAQKDIAEIEKKTKGSKEDLAKGRRELDLAVQQKRVDAADQGVKRLETLSEKSTDPAVLNALSTAYTSQANARLNLSRAGLTDKLAEIPDNPANRDKRAAAVQTEQNAEAKIGLELAQNIAALDAKRAEALLKNLAIIKESNQVQLTLTQAQLDAAKTDDQKAALRAQAHALRLQDLNLAQQQAILEAHQQYDPLIRDAQSSSERNAAIGARTSAINQAQSKFSANTQAENTSFGAEDLNNVNEQTRRRAENLRTEASLTDDLSVKMTNLADATALMISIAANPDEKQLLADQGKREQHTLLRDQQSQDAQKAIAEGILNNLPAKIAEGVKGLRDLSVDPDATNEDRKASRADYMRELVDLVEDHRMKGSDALSNLNDPSIRKEMSPVELAAATTAAKQILETMLKDDFRQINLDHDPTRRKSSLKALQTDISTNPLYKSLGIDQTGTDAVKAESAREPTGPSGMVGEFFNDFEQEASRYASTFVHDLLNPKDRKNIYKDFWSQLEQAGEGALSNVLQKQLQRGITDIFNSAFSSMFGGETKTQTAGNTATGIAGQVAGQVASQAAGNAAGSAAGSAAGAAAGAAGTAAAGSAAGAGASAAGGAFSSMATVAPYLAAVAVLSNPQVEKAITDYISTAAQATAKVVESIGTAVGTVVQSYGKAIESIAQGLGKAVEGIGAGVGKAAEGIGKGIHSVISAFTGADAMRVQNMSVANMSKVTIIQGGGGAAGGKHGGIGGLIGSLIGGAVGGPTGSLIGGAVGGMLGFAGGGRPPVNRSFIAGELGPEIVKIGSPGMVYDADATRAMLASSRTSAASFGAPGAPMSSLMSRIASTGPGNATSGALERVVRALSDIANNTGGDQGDVNMHIYGDIKKEADVDRLADKVGRRLDKKRRSFTPAPSH